MNILFQKVELQYCTRIIYTIIILIYDLMVPTIKSGKH